MICKSLVNSKGNAHQLENEFTTSTCKKVPKKQFWRKLYTDIQRLKQKMDFKDKKYSHLLKV